MELRRKDLFDEFDISDLLSGQQEVDSGGIDADQTLNQNFAENVFNRFGLLYEPVLDQGDGCEEIIKPSWPDDTEFGVCLTHDVDKIHPWSERELVRTGYRNARINMSQSAPVSAFNSLVGHLKTALEATQKDRIASEHYFEKWLEAERAVGANSTFFFCPEQTTYLHRSNTVYRYDDPVEFEGEELTVAELMQTLRDRGNEIGLHSLWGAVDDVDELISQRRQLESASGGTVQSARQHWLFYDITTTPKTQAEAGLNYDSTLAVTGNIGFRFGTSYPWHLYDLQAEESLDLVEMPLIVQDTALFDSKYMGLSVDKAIKYVRQLGKRVKEVGGVLTLNWHPNTTKRGDRYYAYQQVLKELEEMGAWFGTVAEIGEMWEESGNTFRTAY
jgi:hypothetical protein